MTTNRAFTIKAIGIPKIAKGKIRFFNHSHHGRHITRQKMSHEKLELSSLFQMVETLEAQ
jgi:hypothetical protein